MMPVLRIGNRGQHVAELQRILGIQSDGIFGVVTRNAVITFQRSRGLLVDGIVGNQTWTALRGSAQVTPTATSGKSRVFTHRTARIIETTPDNIELKVIRNTLRGASVNGISGTFFYPMNPVHAQNANGIVVNRNQIIGGASSHAWRGFPHSTLCCYSDGTLGVERVQYSNQISKPVLWAIGGLGLLQSYDPHAEGYSGVYSDVLRRVTASQGGHIWIGYKDGKVYMYWRTNCTRLQTRQDAIALGMQGCVGLDSGGTAQMRHPNLVDAHTSRRMHNCVSLINV